MGFVQAKFHGCFFTITFYFNWPNVLSVERVYICFRSAGTGKYATPTSIFKLPLRTFSGKYKDFSPWLNQRQMGFFSVGPNRVHSGSLLANSSWLLSGKRTAKQPLCDLFKSSWHLVPYMLHVTLLMCALKIAAALDKNFLCYRRAIASHFQ